MRAARDRLAVWVCLWCGLDVFLLSLGGVFVLVFLSFRGLFCLGHALFFLGSFSSLRRRAPSPGLRSSLQRQTARECHGFSSGPYKRIAA